MTVIDETKTSRTREHRAALNAVGTPMHRALAAKAGTVAIAPYAWTPLASSLDPHACTSGEQAGSDDKKVDCLAVTEAGLAEVAMADRIVKMDNGLLGSHRVHEVSEGHCEVAAGLDLGPIAPKPIAPNIPAGKNTIIAELISRTEGGTLGELASATGWQHHTVRAALTRLRQAGFTVELRTAKDGRRTYHHVSGGEASS